MNDVSEIPEVQRLYDLADPDSIQGREWVPRDIAERLLLDALDRQARQTMEALWKFRDRAYGAGDYSVARAFDLAADEALSFSPLDAT